MNKFYLLFVALFMLTGTALAQLDNITGVTLTFTPAMGPTVTATATDGGGGLAVDGPVTLMESTEYDLTVAIESGGNDITSQVTNDADNHQVFFQLMGSIFNGDVDAQDTDSQGLDIGLDNDLTTECTETDDDLSGMLRVVLADLTGMKTANSAIGDGTSLFDLTWTINIEDDTEAPPCENEEEVISDVTLIFTPVDGGDVVMVTAVDPDGLGPLSLTEMGEITLLESTEYILTYEIFNGDEDIGAEIEDEDDEHQLFYSFTDEIFTSPAGDGNIDNAADTITYLDEDENGLPVGLETGWVTECGEETTTGIFEVWLKHQPGIKDENSTAQDGESDFELMWPINVVEDPDAPPCENEEEVILDVTLIFTPVDGGDVVMVTAVDPDGNGPFGLEEMGEINLLESTEYILTYEILGEDNEDIGAEILEEDDEHQFFFAFTDEIFTSPAGDGNIDNASDTITYLDMDENGLPVGLETGWITECGQETTTGTFEVWLKHQPGIKDENSTAQDGESDFELMWPINVLPDPDAPPCENEEEVILDVTLIFTPVDGGDVVTVEAIDPDGNGPFGLEEMGEITLLESTEYILTFEIFGEDNEDIGAEILEEDDEHQFFYAFTDEIFRSPAGDGNIDNASDTITYLDMDENGLPVGLETGWVTECDEETTTGTFEVWLKHQPGIKDENSTAQDGESDFELMWPINLIPDPDAPPCENEEEVISDVTLIFTPMNGDAPVETVVAIDPDGIGPFGLEEMGAIDLVENQTYTLTFEIFNGAEDIGAEILEEDDEHQFFFSFTEGIFADPTGSGNIADVSGDINYEDMDENGLPVGLITTWSTTSSLGTGEFTVWLQHQPGIKDANTTSQDGESDFRLTFPFNTVSDVDDLEDELSRQLVISPNPAEDQLNWQLTGELINSRVDISIISMTGQVLGVYRSPNPQIDISQLPTGSYIFQLQTGQARVSKRFIKVN
ncbi:MAG: T9SS type A sorting domain-containing protein [Bacteroidota bacterium]